MKNRTHIIVLVCIAILSGGLILVALASFMGLLPGQGLSFSNRGAFISGRATYGGQPVDITTEHTETLTLDAFDTLDVNISNADLTIEQGDAFALEYHYYGEVYTLLYECAGGKLRVWDKNNMTSQNGFFGGVTYSGVVPSNTVKITVPSATELNGTTIQNSYGDVRAPGLRAKTLDVKLSSGDLDLTGAALGGVVIDNSYGDVVYTGATENAANGGTLKVELSSGDLTLGTMNYQDAEIDNSYGAVELTDCVLDEVEIDMSSGDLSLSNLQAGKLEVQNSYGIVKAKNLTSGSTSIDASSGDVVLKGTLTGETEISSSYGSIDLTLKGREEDYKIKLKTSYGDLRLGGKVLRDEEGEDLQKYQSTTGGANTLDLDCSSGDVEVVFEP